MLLQMIGVKWLCTGDTMQTERAVQAVRPCALARRRRARWERRWRGRLGLMLGLGLWLGLVAGAGGQAKPSTAAAPLELGPVVVTATVAPTPLSHTTAIARI